MVSKQDNPPMKYIEEKKEEIDQDIPFDFEMLNKHDMMNFNFMLNPVQFNSVVSPSKAS